MKIRKVFIGLFVCFFAVGTLIATSANFSIGRRAVNNSNDKAKVAKSADDQIVELGPDNIAGRVRALIFDNQDSTNQTMYAGGIAGGLFKTTDGGEHWTQVPMYLANGTQVNLPISCMTQTSDGVIYIGTGEGFVESGMNNHISTPVGRGLYRMVNDTNYAVIPATAPASDTISSNTGDWAYINRLAAAEYNNVLYFYAATNAGLYRWKIQSATDWSNAPVKIFSGAVQDVDLSLVKKILFFTSANKIYKITNVESDSQQPVEISSNYIDTSNVSRIEVAVAPSDENFVYAVVADTNGLSKGVYMTSNQQVWEIITTSTTNIFSSKKSGWHNNAITVFPDNPKKIAVGGNALWIGEGFDGATLYTWTKPASIQSDIYSAGVTFYELLTGHVPFDKDNAVNVAVAHVKEKFPPVSKYLPTCPTEIEKIVAKATNKRLSERYKSASEFYQDLVDLKNKNPNALKEKKPWFKRIFGFK